MDCQKTQIFLFNGDLRLQQCCTKSSIPSLPQCPPIASLPQLWQTGRTGRRAWTSQGGGRQGSAQLLGRFNPDKAGTQQLRGTAKRLSSSLIYPKGS